MPPCGMPHDATCPSVSSPTEWCISTYAVPGVMGPAHVPMMPFTDCTPITTGSSNHRSRRSAALIVKSRVISATVRSSISLRSDHASCPTSFTSLRLVEEMCGGVRFSKGCMSLPMRPIHS